MQTLPDHQNAGPGHAYLATPTWPPYVGTLSIALVTLVTLALVTLTLTPVMLPGSPSRPTGTPTQEVKQHYLQEAHFNDGTRGEPFRA